MREIIRSFGLNERETEVYIALLKLKEGTAPTISKLTKINKSTVYLELEGLINMGLASYVVKNGVKYFKPANPNKFLDILESKKEKMKEIIPQLSALSFFEKPHFVVYEGKEGLKTSLRDILYENKDILVFGACGNIFEKMKYYFPNLIKTFSKTNIKIKYIVNGKREDFENTLPKKRAEIKYLNLKSDVATIIYGDKVAIQSLNDDMYAAVINDKRLAESYKSYFNFMWKSIK
ncbi:MAG: helix-turn-helix domain-containing protein [Candidatus Woesearchaeota archaeon]|jgi:sugar-specific transcriptional regulator TrmB